MLLAELAMVEEEIVWLEGKVEELKLCLYQEKKQNREWETQRRRLQQKQQLTCKTENGPTLKRYGQSEEFRKQRRLRERKASETRTMSSTRSNGNNA